MHHESYRDDSVTWSEEWFECHVCKLSMSEYEFDDLCQDPSAFTKRNQPDSSWDEYYQLQHFQENIYDYI